MRKYAYSVQVALMLSLCNLAKQADALEKDGFFYTVEGKCATVTGCTLSNVVGELTIPSRFDKATVTAIGDSAFEGFSNVTCVTLPDEVKTIGARSFAGCASLTQVSFGLNLELIGPHAFAGCTALTGIELPALVEVIGEGAFEGCTALSAVAMDNKVETVGAWAFAGDAALSNITFSAALEQIDAWAFASCNSLTKLVLPDHLEKISTNAFASCGTLTSVVLGAAVERLDDRAFYDCTNLVSVSFLCDAPSLGIEVFGLDVQATAYYARAAAGWTNVEMFGDIPANTLSFCIAKTTAGASGDDFSLTVHGPAGCRFVVEACTTLGTDWKPLETNEITVTAHNYIDRGGLRYPSRFYRVRGL